MNAEHEDPEVVETFRRRYEQLVDHAPVSDPEWRPMLSARGAPTHLAPRGWMVAATAVLITVAFGLGWLVSPSQASAGSDPFQAITGTTMTAVPETSGEAYSTPAEAAIAYADSQEPEIEGLRVTRIVGIYADQRIVDLRVQVQADDFCYWYGVMGQVERSELAWRGGPAQPCDGA